ncbi:protein of unknown function [Streptomyces murinus]
MPGRAARPRLHHPGRREHLRLGDDKDGSLRLEDEQRSADDRRRTGLPGPLHRVLIDQRLRLAAVSKREGPLRYRGYRSFLPARQANSLLITCRDPVTAVHVPTLAATIADNANWLYKCIELGAGVTDLDTSDPRRIGSCTLRARLCQGAVAWAVALGWGSLVPSFLRIR